MKTCKYLFTALAISLSMNSFAETRYISDDIYIYLHSGPSLEYRIIGTLQAGTEVNTLKYDEQTKFMQVKASTGKTGWVKVSELQNTLPASILLPKVQSELLQTKKKLAEAAKSNQNADADKEQALQEQSALLSSLQNEKEVLQETILALKAKNLELDLLQETKESRIQMQWVLTGGGVLTLGLLIGFMIPFLPRRKKRNNNW